VRHIVGCLTVFIHNCLIYANGDVQYQNCTVYAIRTGNDYDSVNFALVKRVQEAQNIELRSRGVQSEPIAARGSARFLPPTELYRVPILSHNYLFVNSSRHAAACAGGEPSGLR
jgi:hypothetical protein